MPNKTLFAFILFVCVWLNCEAVRNDGQIAPIYSMSNVNNIFSDFKSKNEKIYASPEEESDRFAIFKANLEKYNDVNGKFNNEKSNTYLEINPYSDWTEEEASVFNGSGSMMKNYDSI